MEDVFDFPMTLEEAEVIHNSLLEIRNTYYVGYAKYLSVEKRELIANLIDNFGTWIENRRGGE